MDHKSSEITPTPQLPPTPAAPEDPCAIELKIKKLEYLCLHIDPFHLQEISEEHFQLLLEFDLDPLQEDPFSLTNKLLQMLDSHRELSHNQAPPSKG